MPDNFLKFMEVVLYILAIALAYTMGQMSGFKAYDKIHREYMSDIRKLDKEFDQKRWNILSEAMATMQDITDKVLGSKEEQK